MPPTSYLSHSFASFVKSGDCQLCVLGDSTVTDGSSAANLPLGIHRAWEPDLFVARFWRVVQGPDVWAGSFIRDSTFYTAAQPDPGTAFSGGQSALSPNQAADWTFTGATTQFHEEAVAAFADGSNYAGGDPFASLAAKCRILYWRDTGMAKLQFVAKRDGTDLDWPGTSVDMAGSAGMLALDVDCSDSAGAPGMGIRGGADDETGKEAYFFAMGAYRHSGGTRLAGFGLSQHGEGGWDSADFVNVSQCSDANLTSFIQHTFANTFMVYVGTNCTAAENTDLNAGQTAVFKAGIKAIITRYRARAIAAGVSNPRFLLVNPHRNTSGSAPSALNQSTRGLALYELALEDGHEFIDLYQLAGDTSGDTGDGIHPTAAGAERWAGLLWDVIDGAATATPASSRAGGASRVSRERSLRPA